MRLPRWLRRKRRIRFTDVPRAYTPESLRAKVEAMPSIPILTEERVREIVREEMARSARRVGRTPGLAGSMKK